MFGLGIEPFFQLYELTCTRTLGLQMAEDNQLPTVRRILYDCAVPSCSLTLGTSDLHAETEEQSVSNTGSLAKGVSQNLGRTRRNRTSRQRFPDNHSTTVAYATKGVER